MADLGSTCMQVFCADENCTEQCSLPGFHVVRQSTSEACLCGMPCNAGEYGAYQSGNGDIYIIAARAARNMSYQDRFPETGKAEPLMTVKGQDLIGVPLKVYSAAVS